MKLHRMEITAFGPFAGHEVVDFDALNQAGVFLLNGETGSGKTSVLDAICFALYGSGPLSAAKGGRKAQQSDHADPHTAPRVEVEFSAGGRRWWVARTPAWREPSTRAASGWSERHANVLLLELTDGTWVERGYRPDDVGQQIHHAIGLDREQFTQVMMLPQGQFARFLQAGSKDREQLLETLFGTDVYAEIQDELKGRADAARAQWREAQAEAERTEELLERLRERLDQAVGALPEDVRGETGGAVASSEEDADVVAGPVGASSGVDGASAERTTGGEPDPSSGHDPAGRWERLTGTSAAVVDTVERARRDATAEHDQAREHVSRLQQKHENVVRHTELSRQRARLLQDAERAERTERELENHEAALALHEPLSLARETAHRVGEAADRVAGLRAELAADSAPGGAARQLLGERSAVLDEQLETGGFSPELRNAVVSARETARATVRRAEALAQEQAQAERERQRLQGLEEDQKRLEEQLDEARSDVSLREQEQQELQAGTRDEALVRERARVARDAVVASREYARARFEEQERARGYERDEAARRDAARRVEHLETQRYAHAAASLAEELTAGEPCPVCGSSSHPDPARASGGEEVTAAALDSARAARDEAQAAADESHAAWQRAQRTATEALARGADTDLDAVLERARQAAEEEENVVAQLERVQNGAQALAAARETVAALDTRMAQVTGDVAASRARADDLTLRCGREQEGIDAELRGFESAAVFLERAEELLSTVDAWETAHRALEGAQRDARASEQAAQRALAASPFPSAEDASEALLDPQQAETGREWLAGHRQELTAVEAELATQNMRDVGRLSAEELAELSEESVARAVSRRDELEALRDRLTQQLGGLQTLHSEVLAAAHRVPEQVEAHRRIRERSEMLAGLSDVATANSSENSLRMTLTSFVLAAKLEQVAAVASEHLSRMSSGRFTLVHTDRARGGGKSGLGLEIDDAWTGNRRGTETLSGGESFFTSLALALALADVVRAEAGGQDIDTLFVDEGFGSLDEQTLEQVLETLDGLRRDGRVIGVVSHVSEMKQRIETQLVVTKTPQGSHLEVVSGLWGPA